MRKRLLALCLALITVVALMAPVALAAEPAAAEEPQAETRAIEYMWYFREYNGVLQMRLWNITYGRWETEWENVTP